MRYVTEYANIAEARSASAAIATDFGCGKRPEDITRYWYPVHEHPSSKRGAMEVEDDFNPGNGKQKNTRAQMVSAGWFADEDAK